MNADWRGFTNPMTTLGDLMGPASKESLYALHRARWIQTGDIGELLDMIECVTL